jgi:DNA polymerase III subunit delta'
MAWADFPDARHSVGLLQRSLQRGRLGHAYLFTSDSLPLLERVARELARSVTCAPPGSDPTAVRVDACGVCSSCRRSASGQHPDVYWLRAESKLRVIKVEQVRELIGAMQLKPAEGRAKVGVLVGADRLNAQGANAFLKTLEEPPPRSLLILLSTAPERLLETIVSRCLRLSFPADARPDPDQIAWLDALTTELTVPPRSFLARYRLLDSVLRRLAVLRESAEAAVGARAQAADPADVDPDVREQWEEEAKAAVEAEYRRLRGETLGNLQSWLRDVWWMTQSREAHLLTLPALADRTVQVADRLDPVRAQANLDVLEQTQSMLHTNVQEALALEVAMLRLHL